MQEELKYIKKIEIEHLWNNPSFNFSWELNPDVNVLAGDNGSGKSTFLYIIERLLLGDSNQQLSELVDKISITFNNDKSIYFKKFRGSIPELEKEAIGNSYLSERLEVIKKGANNYENISSISFDEVSFSELEINYDELANFLRIDVIDTFDQEILNIEAISKQYKGETIKTSLDYQIAYLQKQYLNYQVNLSKRVFSAANNSDEIAKIGERHALFQKSINQLFSESGKRLNENENEISFLINETKVETYELSSGEKQILIILLTVLLMDEKPSILLLDEPEISLHTDWQEEIIGIIKKFNPNAQIIIATHSPFIISQGWSKKVFQIEKLRK